MAKPNLEIHNLKTKTKKAQRYRLNSSERFQNQKHEFLKQA